MFSLYLHVPFCRGKCPYCDFFSVPGQSADLDHYADLLLRHLSQAAATTWAGGCETVFFGGGTPSLLSPRHVAGLLQATDRIFGLHPGAEITLEANPASLSPATLAGFRAAGVTRLSLGVQSLRADNLRRLGRGHTPAQARAAVAQARAAGFDNLGVDFMFGLPGQTTQALGRDLEEILALQTDHISLYGLTIEEGTAFQQQQRAGQLQLPGEEVAADMYRLLHQRLRQAGFNHYEISNFAREGYQCRHNLRYWQRRPCLGLGAGAHSFLDRGWGERRAVPPDLGLFRQRLEAAVDPSDFLEDFDRRGAMAETLYLGLRTAAGVAEAEFGARFGIGVAEAFAAAVQGAGRHLSLRQGRWRLDLEGWLLFDHFIVPFL